MKLSVIISFLVIASLEPALAQNAYVRLGKQSFIDGDFKTAVLQLEKACLIDSTNSNALWMLGYSYYHSDNYLKSIATFTKVIAITPVDASAYYYRARAKCYLGNDYQISAADKEKYLFGAIVDLTKAITINPNADKISSFYQNRGIAYREYAMFKLQPNSRFYDKNRGIEALKASVADLEKVSAAEPSRSDITSLIDISKEKLAGAVGHH